MSNSPHGAELEEEEEFYESLDRVLSSSCSSTSASDNEGDYCHQNHHRRRSGFLHPSTISLDVWLSDPGSVEERRRRLLQQIGLAGEPALTWVKPYGGGGCVGEMGRSVSCHGFCCGARDCPSAGAFARSRSDGSVQTVPIDKQQPPGAGKPPLVSKSTSTVGGEVRMLHGYGDADREDAKRCTIKNLDNGKEFVVKEFREDGMWNKLGEVGTGRQLTMEEFEICVGSSPIVQELMRRQNVETVPGNRSKDGSGSSGGGRSKRSSSWFRSFKNVMAGGQQRERPSSDEKESSSEKGGRRSSSATDESQDSPQSLHCGPERMKVRHYGKYHKELTGLYLSQKIQAHNGSIWTIKFSLDGHYVASAGEDLVIHVWQVFDHERRTELHVYRPEPEIGSGNPLVALVGNGSAEQNSALECMDDSHWEKKRRAKASGMRSSDNLTVPEQVFALSERPVCTFAGHLDEVLDLSWSESQYLLSSSMDKTVRLWHFSSNSCLKIFSHSDYVTCIQFNPIDDRYFISGSLDAKVRIWSIPNRQVVDWNDLHEMVTAACYTPDGQGAVVGSHKGNCHLYDTSDNKLLHKGQIDLQNKKKKSNHRKITGFQFAPGSSSEVVVTSADSRIRVINGCNVIHKFKGFRNTSSQISACLTANGKYVISASEDSYVYVWKYDADMRPCGSKSAVSVTRSYEHFRCPNVTAAVPWPGFGSKLGEMFAPDSGKENGPHALLSPAEMSSDSGTWPHEKLPSPSSKHSRRSSRDLTCGTAPAQSRSAWGMVIVTSSRGGEIRIYQNFGLPVGV